MGANLQVNTSDSTVNNKVHDMHTFDASRVSWLTNNILSHETADPYLKGLYFWYFNFIYYQKLKTKPHTREPRSQPFPSRWSQGCNEKTRQHKEDKHEKDPPWNV